MRAHGICLHLGAVTNGVDLEAKLGFAVLSEHSGKKIVWPFLLQAYEIFVVSVLPENVCGLLFFTIYIPKMY